VSAPRNAPTVRLEVGHLTAELTSTRGLQRFEVEGLSLLQNAASELEPGVSRLWVRRLHPDGTADVQGLGRRDLPSARQQHEHTLAVLASAPAEVALGATARSPPSQRSTI